MVFVRWFVCLRQCFLSPELSIICYAAKDDGLELLILLIFCARVLGH